MRLLTLDLLNSQPRTIQNSVHSEITIGAEGCSDQHKSTAKEHNLPSDSDSSSTTRNPPQDQVARPAITFTRQVAALTEWPALAELAPDIFPEDVLARAKELCTEIGSIGAYAHNKGVPLIRRSVAGFIEERDGYPASPDDIFLTAGASAGVSLLINLLITDPASGILIPIPEHPLYTATVAKHQGHVIPYLLDEPSNNSQSISAALVAARNEGMEPKAIVVINPGSPTGPLLTSSAMEELVTLCEEHELVLLADEVYQNDLNDAEQRSFTSFKKIVRMLNSPIPLVSFHSISKGVSGECGRRGGYFELCNISPDVSALIYRLVSAGLDPPLSGQIGVDSMVRPPKEGAPSYALWKTETDAIRKMMSTKIKNNTEDPSAADGQGATHLP
ncbi:alanine aminotransferase [Mycena albidolilacea]|uniref:Alanine aminotransferase n=1 Tax=Mycena albidolilacea TaxID=1033008 RepID=A0AAD7E7U7_9AGAR|nr:alanine aminotransferase [Mycena albidolilacea]